MNELWETIIASTAVAALISGIISVIVVRLQYNNTLRLNRNNRKWDLTVEALRNFQNAFTKIDNSQNMSISENKEAIIASAFMDMSTRAYEKMTTIKNILVQIVYLIPRERAAYFVETCAELEKSYIKLLASAYNYNGLLLSKNKVEVIPPEQLSEYMQKYIDDTQKLSEEIKDEIISALRELLGT